MAQQVVLCSAIYFGIRGSSDHDQPASAEFQGELCIFEVNPCGKQANKKQGLLSRYSTYSPSLT